MRRTFFYALLGGIACIACTDDKISVKPGEERLVKVAEVTAQGIVKKEFTGMVEPVEYATLAFPLSGQLKQLKVVEGDRIKRGQLIATIGTTVYDLDLATQKAAYETARAERERNIRLLEHEAISRQAFEISEANFQKALSAYEIAQSNLQDTRLIAPFDGSIERRLVEPYQQISAGQSIVVLVNTNELRIRFSMPDAYLYLLHSPEQHYQVKFDNYPERWFNARLEEFLDISTYSTGIPVTLSMNDTTFADTTYDIKPGFTCTIRMTSDITPYLDKPLTNIPMSAVFTKNEDERTYVWVVRNGSVQSREVTVYAPTDDDDLLIESGLQEGERIVTAGVYQLTEGEKVRIDNRIEN